MPGNRKSAHRRSGRPPVESPEPGDGRRVAAPGAASAPDEVVGLLRELDQEAAENERQDKLRRDLEDYRVAISAPKDALLREMLELIRRDDETRPLYAQPLNQEACAGHILSIGRLLREQGWGYMVADRKSQPTVVEFGFALLRIAAAEGATEELLREVMAHHEGSRTACVTNWRWVKDALMDAIGAHLDKLYLAKRRELYGTESPPAPPPVVVAAGSTIPPPGDGPLAPLSFHQANGEPAELHERDLSSQQGPYAPGCFRWEEIAVEDIPRPQWKLLAALFDNGLPKCFVEDGDIIEQIYGAEADAKEEAAEKVRLRLNARLARHDAGSVERARGHGGVRYEPPRR